jgi:hypothetical protein
MSRVLTSSVKKPKGILMLQLYMGNWEMNKNVILTNLKASGVLKTSEAGYFDFKTQTTSNFVKSG